MDGQDFRLSCEIKCSNYITFAKRMSKTPLPKGSVSGSKKPPAGFLNMREGQEKQYALCG